MPKEWFAKRRRPLRKSSLLILAYLAVPPTLGAEELLLNCKFRDASEPTADVVEVGARIDLAAKTMVWGNDAEARAITVTATKIDLQFPPLKIPTVCDEQIVSKVDISINRINGSFRRSELIEGQTGELASLECRKRAATIKMEIPKSGIQVGKCERLSRPLF